MTTIIDNWGLRYPGIKKVEHVYFYHVDDDNSQGYLQQAYRLGKDFSTGETDTVQPEHENEPVAL